MDRSLDERVAAAMVEYTEALESGRPPDRDRFLARHSEVSAELAPCLDAIDLMFGRADEAAPSPRTLGDFELIRQIGRGGMGVVYEAEQISLQRRVALKMLPFAGILDQRHLRRFRNEARAAAHLHHSNIVPVYSVGSERGVHFYAMQFIDGVSVAEMIQELKDTAGRDQPSSSVAVQAVTGGSDTRSTSYCRAVARLGVQAAEALDHAHEQGVVHRDVKPGNLLLDTTGQLWITDFGLASFRSVPGPTLTGDLVGTVRYMSPEQALAKRVPVDHRTDVYSLGVTLYELLTLRPAFPGDDAHKIIQEIAFKEPRPPRQLNRSVPEELETILLKAIAKSPDDRYATAGDLATDLERFLADRPILARRPGPLKRVVQWGRRHRTLVGAAAGLLLLVALGLAIGSAIVWRAYERESRQHTRARTNLELALRALDEIYLDEAESRLRSAPLPADAERRFIEKGLAFYRSFIDANREDATVRWETALALRRAGLLRWELGQVEAALDDLAQAADLLEHLTGVDEIERKMELAASLTTAGRFCLETNRLDEAAQSFSRAWELLQTLPPTPEHRSRLAHAIAGVAEAGSMRDGRWTDALETLRQALRIHDEACAAEPGNQRLLLRRLVLARNIGLALHANGMLTEAVDTLHGAREVAVESGIAQERDDVRYELTVCDDLLGSVLLDCGRLAEAEEVYRRCIGACRDLVADAPNFYVYRLQLACALHNLAMVLGSDARFREALELYVEAKGRLEEVVAAFPDVTMAHRNLQNATISAGNCRLAFGEHAGAELAYREAIRLCGEERDRFGPSTYVEARLVDARSALGEVLRCRGRLVEAEQELQGALALAQKLAGDLPEEPKRKDRVASVWNGLGQVRHDMGNLPGAQDCYREAIRIFETLDSARTPTQALALAQNYVLLAYATGRERVEEREGLFERAVAVVEEVTDETGAVEHRATLVNALADYGSFLYGEARLREAQEVWERALEIQDEVSRERPEVDQYKWSHARRLGDLAALAFQSGQPLKGLMLTRKAVERMNAVRSDIPALPEFKQHHCQLLSNLGQTEFRLGRHADAKKTLERALALCPEDPAVLCDLAWMLAVSCAEDVRDVPRALELAERACRSETASAGCWATLAVARYHADWHEGAIEAVGKARGLAEIVPLDLFVLAMAHKKLGNQDRAREFHRKAQEWMRANPRMDPDLTRFAREAKELFD